jgi:hypothetical protein
MLRNPRGYRKDAQSDFTVIEITMKRWIVVILVIAFLVPLLSKLLDQSIWAVLIGILVVGYFAINLIGGAKEELGTTANTHPEPVMHWPALGHFDFEVVGESNYQDAITSIVGDHGDQPPADIFNAVIIPENDNKYDALAIRIDIDSKTVGYMSREDARSFRRRLGAKKMKNQVTTCAAMIVGGFITRNGDRASYGVRLDLKPFE